MTANTANSEIQAIVGINRYWQAKHYKGLSDEIYDAIGVMKYNLGKSANLLESLMKERNVLERKNFELQRKLDLVKTIVKD